MADRGEGPRAPAILVERAVAAGVDRIEQVLQEAGAEPGYVYVSMDARGVPDGELDATTTGRNFVDEMELLAFMVARAQSQAETLGIRLNITIDGPIGG